MMYMKYQTFKKITDLKVFLIYINFFKASLYYDTFNTENDAHKIFNEIPFT